MEHSCHALLEAQGLEDVCCSPGKTDRGAYEGDAEVAHFGRRSLYEFWIVGEVSFRVSFGVVFSRFRGAAWKWIFGGGSVISRLVELHR